MVHLFCKTFRWCSESAWYCLARTLTKSGKSWSAPQNYLNVNVSWFKCRFPSSPHWFVSNHYRESTIDSTSNEKLLMETRQVTEKPSIFHIPPGSVLTPGNPPAPTACTYNDSLFPALASKRGCFAATPPSNVVDESLFSAERFLKIRQHTHHYNPLGTRVDSATSKTAPVTVSANNWVARIVSSVDLTCVQVGPTQQQHVRSQWLFP